MALPSYQAAKITKYISSDLSETLGKIKYAPIAVVCSGYDEKAVRYPIDGFGFLVPQKENQNILGSIWTSSIFKDRAPDGKIQFRSMVGGDGNHDSINLSDEELTSQVTNDLAKILNISSAPEFVKIYRWKYGIPQYHIGHSEVMRSIEENLTQNGNLFITGNAYYGISLNDCIKQSYKITRDI